MAGLETIVPMLSPHAVFPLAAAGWAFLVWLFGGGVGLAIIVFILMKMLGR